MLAGGAVVSIVGFSSSADIVFDQESVTAIARIVAGNPRETKVSRPS